MSGILQNHNFQIDVLAYDLTFVIKSLYFNNNSNISEKKDVFFNAYKKNYPLINEEYLALPVLTASKFLQNTITLIQKHLNDNIYRHTHLNYAAISLVHAEKALHL